MDLKEIKKQIVDEYKPIIENQTRVEDYHTIIDIIETLECAGNFSAESFLNQIRKTWRIEK